LYTDVFRSKYIFNVSIREYFSVLNVSIVCIRNTARSKWHLEWPMSNFSTLIFYPQ
jgi:hypothetical protein